MPSTFVEDLRVSLGLTSRQMADLLWIPHSGFSMAAGGHRPIPSHLLPWMMLLRQMANFSQQKKVNAASMEKIAEPQQAAFAMQQIRLLRLELKKNELQQERVEAKLQKTETLCTWLPQLLDSALCQSDPDRKSSTELLLRQSTEQRQIYWEQANHLRAKLLALQAAIDHWSLFVTERK
jgi:hypothetical protein